MIIIVVVSAVAVAIVACFIAWKRTHSAPTITQVEMPRTLPAQAHPVLRVAFRHDTSNMQWRRLLSLLAGDTQTPAPLLGRWCHKGDFTHPVCMLVCTPKL